MPIVQVFYRFGKKTPEIAEALRDGVRRVGIARLSVPVHVLKPESLMFKFHEPDKEDDLQKDFIVLLPLHAFMHRTAQGPDVLAGQIAEAIATNWRKLPDVELSVGVEMVFGTVGWGVASSAAPAAHRE